MSLRIIKAGILDTVQDLGRYGYQHLGINPGGAMDRFSASLANALLGKEENSPVIEMHFPAAQILFQKACVICLTGGHFSPLINNVSVPLHQPIIVSEGSLLSFGKFKTGARCYLSLLNELVIDKWLGSYSTNTKAAAGGFNGKKLEKNDSVDFNSIELAVFTEDFIVLPWLYNNPPLQSKEIEFIPGNEWNWLTTKTQTDFLNNDFIISSASDRMGYRLQGKSLEQKHTDQLISSPVNFGTVQLLPNGQLIILMADHQTIGGYPRIANIIGAHLSRLAQMNPAEEIKFRMTNVASAEEKIVAQQNYLLQLQNTCNLKMQNWFNVH